MWPSWMNPVPEKRHIAKVLGQETFSVAVIAIAGGVLSGILYRMKQNAAGLASICVLSTMVLVMISMTVSMFAGVDDELKARYPYEVNYMDRSEIMDPTVDVQELYQKMTDTIQAQGREIIDSESFTQIKSNFRRFCIEK